MKKFFASILLAALIFQVSLADWEAPEEDSAPAVRLPVVMYHHIAMESERWGDYVVSVEEFESDLRYFQEQGYTSISVQELCAWYDGNFTMPDKPMMITFDDGYESTAVYAVPLLERYGFQAIVAVIGSVAQMYTDEPDHTIQYAHMDWETVRTLSQGDTIEIQYHTWDMHRLDSRRGCMQREGESDSAYREALLADMEHFAAACQEQGVALCGSIAYPFGAWNDITLETAKEFGFRAAFTCSEEINFLTGNPEELYHIGRFNRAHGKSSAAFFSVWA